MSLVRLLGFRTLGCGCVIGQYRELATSRELTYVEEKASAARCTVIGGITRSMLSACRRAPRWPSRKLRSTALRPYNHGR